MLTSDCGVSVIVPAFNACQTINAGIASVVAQTVQRLEIVIIDDHSNDGTWDEIRRLMVGDSRIRAYRQEKPSGGPACPRNIGVQLARYPLVAFLDADDLWHPQKLELQLAELWQRPTAFLCSAMRDFRSDSEIVYRQPEGRAVQFVTFQMQRRRARIPTSSVLASREALLEHPFDERPSYRAVEDYDCWLRILSTGVVCTKVGHELVYYRKTGSQLSKGKGSMLGKVFMVHRAFSGGNVASAFLYTATHALGGIVRHLTKRM